MGVSFSKTQYKYGNENKKTNIKGESHFFHCVKQYHFIPAYTDLE